MFERTDLAPGRARLGLAALAGIVFLATGGLSGASAIESKAERAVLENGIKVLMLPIPEADRVAIETFYEVGFVHEPKGMTQAAHLLEHLVCNAATKSYQQNESMNLLNEIGMANAETLPDWTHYDYVVPTQKLELALRIEAERLTSLRIEREIIQVEARRCYLEADSVERNPAGGMAKHAFMAMSQAWRHGMTSALIRGGMEDFSIEKLERFHLALYRPDNLTLVMVGGFQPDHAWELISKHLGSIRPRRRDQPEAIEWSKIPKHTTVRWDAKVRAVCLAFPAPTDRSDRVALSLVGSALTQGLMNDPQIKAVTNSVACTSHLWSVGELPFYVYATVKPDASLEEVERALTEWVRSVVSEKPADSAVLQMRMMANQLSQQVAMLDWNYVQNAASMVAKRRGGDQDLGLSMVLGQSAINWGVADRLMGPDLAKSASELSLLTAEKLHDLMRRYLEANKQFVTVLLPAEGWE